MEGRGKRAERQETEREVKSLHSGSRRKHSLRGTAVFRLVFMDAGFAA